jgi:outer membrane protein W
METLIGGAEEVAGFSFVPYFGLYHGEKRDNDAWIIPIGIQARWSLSEHGSLRPYVGIGIAGYGIKFEDRSAGVDTGWRSAFGGRFTLGMDITRWFNVEAAYNIVSEVKDYDLSGFSLQGKFRIYF